MTSSGTSGTAVVTLPEDKQILITREFDAPKELVYRAWTEPELIKQWWGAKRGDVDVVEVDFRVGGTWRYVMTAQGGMEVGFHGEYREIVPNERIVSTEAFEGIPDPDEHASTNTLTLTEENGRTTMTVLVEHPTKEGRDMHIQSGMEGGMNDSYAALDALLAKAG